MQRTNSKVIAVWKEIYLPRECVSRYGVRNNYRERTGLTCCCHGAVARLRSTRAGKKAISQHLQFPLPLLITLRTWVGAGGVWAQTFFGPENVIQGLGMNLLRRIISVDLDSASFLNITCHLYMYSVVEACRDSDWIKILSRIWSDRITRIFLI